MMIRRIRVLSLATAFVLLAGWLESGRADRPALKKSDVWSADDLKPGMTGYGVTVIHGTKKEQFQATILGVLKDSSPGTDLVLARVSGLGLEKTGVLAGMSGSPVYIDDKLLGAVAYTWQFGTEPIAGIMPFVHMVEFANPKQEGIEFAAAPALDIRGGGFERIGLARNAASSDRVAVSDGAVNGLAGDVSMTPVLTPLSMTGISPSAREMLAPIFEKHGFVPVQGGGLPAKLKEEFVGTKIEPGSAMAVGLITGDISMTAIGTTTAVVGDRVFGFGHPFFGAGSCEFPLLSAYIHTVIPRQTVSVKMGSVLTPVGKIDADTSTSVAGWLNRPADMIPVSIRYQNSATETPRQFNCQMARERSLIGSLSMAALSSCVDLEGSPPDVMSVKLAARVDIEGHPPLMLDDVFSGPRYSGSRGLMFAYLPIVNLLQAVAANPFENVRISKIDCKTEVIARRMSAQLVHVEVARAVLEAGENLDVVATVQIYPERGEPDKDLFKKVNLSVKLPAALKPGKYRGMVGDAINDFRNELRNRPALGQPNDFAQLHRLLANQLELKNNDLVLRVNLPSVGVAVGGVELPDLPGAVADVLSQDSSRQVFPVGSSLAERKRLAWAVDGARPIAFEIVENKGLYPTAAPQAQ